MIEVLWHGRGGQGAFTAARLLGDAASASGDLHALAFPSFGPERRGAPIRAFTRIDSGTVGDRSAITKADFVVYLDETLVGDHWADELKPDGVALVNSPHQFDDPRLLSLDADRIATEIMGRPQANTALLGALSALCPEINLDALIEALHDSLPERHWAGNEAVLAEAARVMEENRERNPLASDPAASARDTASADAAASTAASAAADSIQQYCDPLFPVVSAPNDPARYAQTTCYAAPLIVKDNAGWRSVRPIVDAYRCTGCGECFAYCPDDAIVMGERPAGAAPNEKAAARPMPHLDELFCKGCGICARVCPTDAIIMAPEQDADFSPAQNQERAS